MGFKNLFKKAVSTVTGKKMEMPDPILETAEGSKVRNTIETLTKKSEGKPMWKVAILAGVSKEERKAAYEEVHKAGDMSISILKALLKDEDRNIRGCAAEALGYLGDRMDETTKEKVSDALVDAASKERFQESECDGPLLYINLKGMVSQHKVPLDNVVAVHVMVCSIAKLGKHETEFGTYGSMPEAAAKLIRFEPVFA